LLSSKTAFHYDHGQTYTPVIAAPNALDTTDFQGLGCASTLKPTQAQRFALLEVFAMRLHLPAGPPVHKASAQQPHDNVSADTTRCADAENFENPGPTGLSARPSTCAMPYIRPFAATTARTRRMPLKALAGRVESNLGRDRMEHRAIKRRVSTIAFPQNFH
jgi:hypothetical protein